jgi:GNAT superfamily N-acetyltransferase
MPHLEAVFITTPDQVESMRLIRNATRFDFSHDHSVISEMHQRAWWVVMRGKIKAWLYYCAGSLVGYGMIRQTPDGRWWNSLAILPEFRGHGYGTAIVSDLLGQNEERIFASVRRDNLPALAMHHEYDWERYAETDGDESLVYFRSIQ